MAYSEKVMDHFQHPRNVGEIENAIAVGIGSSAANTPAEVATPFPPRNFK